MSIAKAFQKELDKANKNLKRQQIKNCKDAVSAASKVVSILESTRVDRSEKKALLLGQIQDLKDQLKALDSQEKEHESNLKNAQKILERAEYELVLTVNFWEPQSTEVNAEVLDTPVRLKIRNTDL